MAPAELQARALWADRAMVWTLPAAAWCSWGPLGLKYLGWLAATSLAVVALKQKGQWHAALQQPAMRWMLAFTAWLLLSAAWSVAPGHVIVAHAWGYVLPPTALLIAAACPPATAERALQHFVWAAAVVALLVVLHAHAHLGFGWLGSSTVTAKGNQRIMTSILLALGAALAFSLVLLRNGATEVDRRRRPWLLLAASVCLLGLASQDRRTGMLLLPLLMLALVLAATRSLKLKLGLVLLVLAGVAAVWTASDSVRARFAEGETELQAYGPNSPAVTSWGQRARMLQLTVEMVRERPLVGHGLGSWRKLLRDETVIGTAIWDNSTPHNEYLLVATQAGLPAVVLLLVWLLLLLWRSWRAGRIGLPALMVWLTVALCGLASAVLRDTKLALPLLVLAGLAGALLRPSLRDN